MKAIKKLQRLSVVILLSFSISLLSACFLEEKAEDFIEGSTTSQDIEKKDFNQNIVFSDYGMYGRTIYFTDNDGQEWCYYDVLKIDSASQLEFIISEPIENQCSIDNSRHFSIFETMITGENKKDDSIIISTSGIHSRQEIYPSNGDYSESNIEFQEKIDNDFFPTLGIILAIQQAIFGPIFTSSVIPFQIAEYENTFVANIISPTDYIYFGFPESDDITSIYSILFFSLNTPNPPLDVIYTIATNTEDRKALYTAHPYQRLTPTEDDPYPLIQIRVE